MAVCTVDFDSVSRPSLVRGIPFLHYNCNRISHFSANEMNVAVLIGVKSWFPPLKTFS